MPTATDNPVGVYLRDRRIRLDPAALGFSMSRRRTPGLRREEVAQRANISATWYTWLEQGRGGAPSADVLDRLSRALMLTDAEREHLFIIALGRPPEAHWHEPEAVSPRLQRVLDYLEPSPAIIRTATWDVVAWNRAAAVVLTDYAALETYQRNILRMMFGDGRMRASQPNWQAVARFMVGAFRADAARAGASEAVRALVDDLSRTSPEFEALWRENDVSGHVQGPKQIRHPHVGVLGLEYSAFAVDGRPELTMVVYTPATAADADKIRGLMAAQVAKAA
jgi:transcriptional regulator with XRE-family HTH domain